MDEALKPAGIQTSKRIILERIALAPGEAVLEVRCGPGADVFDLVDVVGPTSRLVGLDASATMIAEARHRAQERHARAPSPLRSGRCRRCPSRTARLMCAVPRAC